MANATSINAASVKFDYFVVKFPRRNPVILKYDPGYGKILYSAYTEGAALKWLDAYNAKRKRNILDFSMVTFALVLISLGVFLG